MKKIVVDCSTQVAHSIDLTATEEADYNALQAKSAQERADKAQRRQDAIDKRTQAIQTILTAPEVAKNPALVQAFGDLLTEVAEILVGKESG